FFFQAEDGIRAFHVTGVQTCALPISFVIAAIGTVSVALFGGRAAAVLGVLFPYLVFRHYYWRRLHFISILWALGFAFVFVVLWRSEERRVGKTGKCGLRSVLWKGDDL